MEFQPGISKGNLVSSQMHDIEGCGFWVVSDDDVEKDFFGYISQKIGSFVGIVDREENIKVSCQ